MLVVLIEIINVRQMDRFTTSCTILAYSAAWQTTIVISESCRKVPNLKLHTRTYTHKHISHNTNFTYCSTTTVYSIIKSAAINEIVICLLLQNATFKYVTATTQYKIAENAEYPIKYNRT